MKIVTWNVNGLRAALGKDILSWASSYRPDVLCLQEIKSRPEQLEPDNMHQLETLFHSQTS